MTGPIDPRRYLLPEAESQAIFTNRIVPRELARGVPQEDPVVVFVAGQPGAGKTRTTDAVKDRLDRRGGAVVVNSDFYKPFHPEYRRLLAEDDRNAAPYTSMDGRRWMAAAERHLIDHRVDTIVETTMRDPGDFVEPARMFRDAGYRVEAVIMAVPESLSRLGIVDRYQTQVEQNGHGRLTARENHDASYRGVLDAARTIDEDRIVDAVTVYRRGNVQLYHNTLTADGLWRDAPGAADAIETERHRPWTAEETRTFAASTARLAERAGPAWREELADITRLAEPVADPNISLPNATELGSGPSTEVERAGNVPAASPPQQVHEVGGETSSDLRRAADALSQARQAIDGTVPYTPHRRPDGPEVDRPDLDRDAGR